MKSLQALAEIWALGGLPAAALDDIALSGGDPVFPSSFAVGTAARQPLARPPSPPARSATPAACPASASAST